MRTVPRLVIAGITSGVGKTTIATGIIGALRARGLRVQPFKCGPDYIDPGYLGWGAGIPARNLDSWMLPHPVVKELYLRAAANADIAVIEGVMGLFDGRFGEGEAGSTAQIAKLLGAPVVLVMDVSKVARSAAATVLGYQHFDPGLPLAGVILNQIGSERHREMVTEAITAATGLPVLGALPRTAALQLEERHLGLVPTTETPVEEETLQRLVAEVASHCDMAALLSLAQRAAPLDAPTSGLFPRQSSAPRVPLAVAQDRAFSFYYQENLELLEAWGAELAPFSPLADAALPRGVAGLYLGGGFPEMYAAELAANTQMIRCVREAAQTGMPLFAECGGLMYLTRGITDLAGQRHPMAGVVPGSCVMERRRVGLGYLTVRACKDSLLLPKGEAVRAHEFHWSRFEGEVPQEQAAFQVDGQPGRREGYAQGNLLASYAHIHLGARPELAPRFVAACRAWM